MCGYHAIENYIKTREKLKITSKYLFPYKYGGRWRPFYDNLFRRKLKELFEIYFNKDYNPKKHKAHGFRYGGITDLGSIGIPVELIRRISGHAPDSKVLFLYLKLAPETVAALIKSKSKEAKNIIKQYKKAKKTTKKRR